MKSRIAEHLRPTNAPVRDAIQGVIAQVDTLQHGNNECVIISTEITDPKAVATRKAAIYTAIKRALPDKRFSVLNMPGFGTGIDDLGVFRNPDVPPRIRKTHHHPSEMVAN